MFEFTSFIKITLAAMIAFIVVIYLSIMADRIKEYAKKTIKEWANEEEKAGNFKTLQKEAEFSPTASIFPRFNKGDKIYIINRNPSFTTDFKTILPGTVIKPPNEAHLHFLFEEYILEMEDGTYIKAPRREIHLRNWLIWREEINELPDEPTKNTLGEQL